MPSLTFIIALFVLVVHFAFVLHALPDLTVTPRAMPALPDFTDFTEMEQRDTIPDPWVDDGPAPAEQVISVSIGFKLPNLAKFEHQFMDLSTPGNPNYGNFLTADQINLHLDPAKDVVDQVLSWLRLAGIKAMHDHQWLNLNLTVAQLNAILQAKYHVYRNPSTGVTIIRTLKYSVPTILLPILDVVLPGTSFDGDLARGATSLSATPLAKRLVQLADCNSQVTPACLQKLYGIPTTRATQSRNEIAVPGFLDEFANRADLNTFAAMFRPDMNPGPTFTEQFIDGGQNPQDLDKAGVEANLDIQYTTGLATGVPTVFVSSGRSDITGFVNMVNFFLQQPTPPTVLTISYGFNENALSPSAANSLCNLFMQLGARGTSVIVASGDGGVGGVQPSDTCTSFVPTFPASCPYVTTVGATVGQPEVGAVFSSGGFSNYFPTAAYQQKAVNHYLSQLGKTDNGFFNRTGRAFPDVSAQGMNIAIAYRGQIASIGGTSASAPIVASVVALLNDRLMAQGHRPLGFLNPLIYAKPEVWTDITEGNNPSCGTNGFPAKSGWDPITGMGTPNFQKWAAAIGV